MLKPFPAQHLAGGTDRVEGVGLRAFFGLAGRPVELDDPLTVALQCDGQARPAASGTFDHPRPPAGDTVAVNERDGYDEAVPFVDGHSVTSGRAWVIQSRSGS